MIGASLHATGNVATPSSIVIGGTVTVSSAGVNVRSTPAGTLVGTQAAGATGTVIGGPVNKVLVTGGPNVVWWDVTFKIAPSGWAGADNLIASAPPPPPPTYHTWNAALNTEEAANPTPTQLLAWVNANPPKAD